MMIPATSTLTAGRRDTIVFISFKLIQTDSLVHLITQPLDLDLMVRLLYLIVLTLDLLGTQIMMVTQQIMILATVVTLTPHSAIGIRAEVYLNFGR